MAAENPLAGIDFEGPELDEDEIAVDAVCIVRIQNLSTGRSRITTYRSSGLDDVVETGMLQIHAQRDMGAWTGPRTPLTRRRR